MYHAGFKRNKAAGTLCAWIYQYWYWRCDPRRHNTHKPTYTLHIHVSEDLHTDHREKPGVPTGTQTAAVASSCFPVGLDRMEGHLLQYCTYTHTSTYLYLHLSIYTGIHSLSLKDTWTAAPHNLWGLVSHPVSGDDVSPGTNQEGAWARWSLFGRPSFGFPVYPRALLSFCRWADGPYLPGNSLAEGLFGLSLLPVVCLLLCVCADKLYHIILQYWTISKWIAQCKSNFLMFFLPLVLAAIHVSYMLCWFWMG